MPQEKIALRITRYWDVKLTKKEWTLQKWEEIKYKKVGEITGTNEGLATLDFVKKN